MIKVILCDADGMLINGEMFSVYLAQKYGITKEKTDPFFTGEFQDCLIGKRDLRKVVAKYLSSWGWQKSVDEFLQEWFEFEHNIDKKLVDYLNILRKKGIKVYLATNQEEHRTQYMLEKMGLAKLLDGVFSSAHLGYKKPDRDFFEQVMDKLSGIQKDEILFWDDQQKNVDGARAFGFRAELYTTLKDFEDKINFDMLTQSNPLRTRSEDKPFHAARRMFWIINDEPIIAAPGTQLSHIEFAEKQGLCSNQNASTFAASHVRGFYLPSADNPILHFYQGEFEFDESTQQIAERVISKLTQLLPMPANTQVYLGPKDSIMHGKKYAVRKIGVIADFT